MEEAATKLLKDSEQARVVRMAEFLSLFLVQLIVYTLGGRLARGLSQGMLIYCVWSLRHLAASDFFRGILLVPVSLVWDE